MFLRVWWNWEKIFRRRRISSWFTVISPLLSPHLWTGQTRDISFCMTSKTEKEKPTIPLGWLAGPPKLLFTVTKPAMHPRQQDMAAGSALAPKWRWRVITAVLSEFCVPSSSGGGHLFSILWRMWCPNWFRCTTMWVWMMWSSWCCLPDLRIRLFLRSWRNLAWTSGRLCLPNLFKQQLLYWILVSPQDTQTSGEYFTLC